MKCKYLNQFRLSEFGWTVESCTANDRPYAPSVSELHDYCKDTGFRKMSCPAEKRKYIYGRHSYIRKANDSINLCLTFTCSFRRCIVTSRTKWDIAIDSEDCISENRNNTDGIDRQTILELLDSNSLTTHFQPIFSSKDGVVYGYEALTRIKRRQ